MSCTCEKCQMCDGQGYYFIGLDGQFAGVRQTDDLEQTETCDECGGDGIYRECIMCLEGI